MGERSLVVNAWDIVRPENISRKKRNAVSTSNGNAMMVEILVFQVRTGWVSDF